MTLVRHNAEGSAPRRVRGVHPRDPLRRDWEGFLFGFTHLPELPSRTPLLDAAEQAWSEGDSDALDVLLTRGLDRRAWKRSEPEPAAGAFLAGGSLRVFEALHARGIRPSGGRGSYVCVGERDHGFDLLVDPAGAPGCLVVFEAGREARWCRRCQRRPVAFAPWGSTLPLWSDHFDPTCRTVVYLRACEVCGHGIRTADPRRVYCSNACRQRAHRARA